MTVTKKTVGRRGNVLRVREHVLFQVMFPDEGPIAEVTLELLSTGVDEHVRRHMRLLGKQLIADRAFVVFLACKDKAKDFRGCNGNEAKLVVDGRRPV